MRKRRAFCDDSFTRVLVGTDSIERIQVQPLVLQDPPLDAEVCERDSAGAVDERYQPATERRRIIARGASLWNKLSLNPGSVRGERNVIMNNTGLRIHYLVLGLILSLHALAATALAAGEDLAQELKQVPYRIVYESYQEGNWDLFTMRADGSDRQSLTHTPNVNELCPHVSPDGSKICFSVDEGTGESTVRSVWCMNVDGTGRRLVARGAREPFWTADGLSIAFLHSESEKFTAMDYATKGLFVFDLAPGRTQSHANPDLHHLYCVCATPDGKWYVASLHAGMGYTHAIVAIEAHGRRVFKLNIPGCRPDVSPDGKRLAWASGDYSLGVGDLDFSGPEPRVFNVRSTITSDKPIKVQHVDWSPDGKYLAFSRGPYHPKALGLAPSIVGTQAPGWDICVADANATNRWVRITTDAKSNKEPDWVPVLKP